MQRYINYSEQLSLRQINLWNSMLNATSYENKPTSRPPIVGLEVRQKQWRPLEYKQSPLTKKISAFIT